jgi:hypothetical protein
MMAPHPEKKARVMTVVIIFVLSRKRLPVVIEQ